MGRLRRIYYKDAISHVIVRGNNRQMVLKSDDDKEDFLESLAKHKERFRFKLYGFVLMDNHAHLVMGTNQDNNISRIMQAIMI